MDQEGHPRVTRVFHSRTNYEATRSGRQVSAYRGFFYAKNTNPTLFSAAEFGKTQFWLLRFFLKKGVF